MYLLGYDIGTSSIKGALVHVEHGATQISKSPNDSMPIIAHQKGWAEQDPDLWWQNVIEVTKTLLKDADVDGSEIGGIGLSYQMHGLVMVDKDNNLVRDSIIWCDSRAVGHGENALRDLGASFCYEELLNAPGNFTASKLKWVKENEPSKYSRCSKILLPGDYIILKMTGLAQSTIGGLSEGIMWNYSTQRPAFKLLENLGVSADLLPPLVDNFKIQAKLSREGASALGLPVGLPITYRAGDQPNNAMSLGANKAGEIAGSGGTSGVIYAVSDQAISDIENRTNTFAHVNYGLEQFIFGHLLCINGAGISYSWLKNISKWNDKSYEFLESAALKITAGAEGLIVLPFGNGAERMLGNKDLGSHWINLNFNIHSTSHLVRSILEGVAFSFYYGMKALMKLGITADKMHVANDNLFRSQIFSQTLCNLIGCEISIVETTGAIGAAKAAGIGLGIYSNVEEAFANPKYVKTFVPNEDVARYKEIYSNWESTLISKIEE